MYWQIDLGKIDYLVHFPSSMSINTDYGRPINPFLSKFQTYGLGQTIWADKFGGIWGIFGRFISTHFGTVSSLSMFSIHQRLFLQKTK